ncbi:GGDEF and EAL domain-containing protein [Cytobacillus firmus]|uniref:putative bifunctional diguanylate cyclase/phosphodiesterase n=1 Tax=Cytobacillus firmus TaxID=1399 RepID=UPI0021875EDC|nr:EAL domain-containing protein [Cytobacillus firmus]URM33356.1 GGDEF and EAL domain-containing protein [Cytobacillus firmus]
MKIRKRKSSGLFSIVPSKNHGNTQQENIDSFKAIYNDYSDAAFLIEKEGKIIYGNEASQILFGYMEDRKEPFTNYFIHSDRDSIKMCFQRTIMEGKAQRGSFFGIQAGQIADIQATFTPAFNGSNISGAYLTLHVPEQQTALLEFHNDELQRELSELKERKKKILESIDAGIWAFDIGAQRFTVCSEGIRKITGRENADFLTGKVTWKDLVFKQDLEKYELSQSLLSEGKQIRHEYRITLPDGSLKWVSDQTIPTLDEHQNLIRLNGIITDINDHKILLHKVQHISYHDSLTNLPLRRLAEKEIQRLLLKSEKFAIFYIGIDRFKYINDILGHTLADEVLIQVAIRFRYFQEKGCFVSRIAGDEFMIIYPIHSKDGSLQGAEEILSKLSKPFRIDSYEIPLQASIGISTFPEDGDTHIDLIKNAHAALHRGKEAGGRSIQVYTKNNDQKTKRVFEIESGLQKALNKEEFILHYQPKMDIQSGRMIGAEALIRWQHPELGLLPPGEFISIAEKTGLILDIGDWVLKQACVQLKLWMNEGLPVVPISINISPQRFLKYDLVNYITRTLEILQIPPALLELEITETHFLYNEERVNSIIQELRKLGIRIALDDFGTGFSSLTHIKDFQIDTLKIDRSFIKEIETNKNHAILVESLIFLSERLGIDVIAEGVETQNQLEFLKRTQCQYVQGFIFSKPLPVEDFVRYL